MLRFGSLFRHSSLLLKNNRTAAASSLRRGFSFQPLHEIAKNGNSHKLRTFLNNIDQKEARGFAVTPDTQGRIPIHLLAENQRLGLEEYDEMYATLQSLTLAITDRIPPPHELFTLTEIRDIAAKSEDPELAEVLCRAVNKTREYKIISSTHPSRNTFSHSADETLMEEIGTLDKQVTLHEPATDENRLLIRNLVLKHKRGNCGLQNHYVLPEEIKTVIASSNQEMTLKVKLLTISNGDHAYLGIERLNHPKSAVMFCDTWIKAVYSPKRDLCSYLFNYTGFYNFLNERYYNTVIPFDPGHYIIKENDSFIISNVPQRLFVNENKKTQAVVGEEQAPSRVCRKH